MSDERIREFFIAAPVADPVEPLQRSTAECFLDVIEQRGLLRDLLTEGEPLSPGLEAALLDADATCPQLGG